METLIGLLFLLLPVIFKVIEKNLQQAGKTDQAGKVREFADLFGDDETVEEIGTSDGFDDDEVKEKAFEIFMQPQQGVQPKPMPQTAPFQRVQVKSVVQSSRKKSPPILLEEEKNRKKEKIDPKKLIVYSEIMKPKYME